MKSQVVRLIFYGLRAEIQLPNPAIGEITGPSSTSMILGGMILPMHPYSTNHVETILLFPFAKGVYMLEIDRGAEVSDTKIVQY